MNPFLSLLIGWLPLWLLLWLLLPGRRSPGWGRLSLAAVLVGLVGSTLFVEFRRYGLSEQTGGLLIAPMGIAIEDFVRFALLGLSGAFVADVFLDRWGPRSKNDQTPVD